MRATSSCVSHRQRMSLVTPEHDCSGGCPALWSKNISSGLVQGGRADRRGTCCHHNARLICIVHLTKSKRELRHNVRLAKTYRSQDKDRSEDQRAATTLVALLAYTGAHLDVAYRPHGDLGIQAGEGAWDERTAQQ